MALRCQNDYPVCSFKYDPRKGDPEHSIKPGTLLDDIPADWICSQCRVEKIKNEKKEEIMDKYECSVCGYVYDPEQGDPENNIPPGTPFEKLPDDWTCPVCGAGKDEFNKVE